MAFFAKKKQSTFIPAPEDLHLSVCCDVVDLGMQKINFQGQESLKDMVRLVWQTEALMPDGKPYLISKRYTNSTHKKATLRLHIQSWAGKSFTDEAFEKFDIERLIGVCCQIQIVHNASSGGDVYANIQAIVPAPKNRPVLKIRNYIRVKDRPGYRAPTHLDDQPQGHGDFPEDVQPTDPADEPPPEDFPMADDDLPF